MPKPLSDLTVRNLPEGVHFDSKLPSFGIRIGKTRKTWFVIRGHNRTKVRIGHYPVMGLSEARNRAMGVLLLKGEERPAIRYKDAQEAFLALKRWRPQTERVLRSNLGKFSWQRNLSDITHEDVITALERIPYKSARFHAFKDLRTFFNWCVPRYLERSPCEGIKFGTQPSRDRVLTDDELRQLWSVLGDTRADTLLRLCILTGQRRGEIQHITIRDGYGHIDGRYTKNGRSHTFPLPELALPYLPPPTYSGWSNAKRRVDKLSGITDWTIHDLRRTYASNLARLGTPIHITEKLLNHVSGSFSGVTGVYQRYSYLKEMRQAVSKYEQFLLELFEDR